MARAAAHTPRGPKPAATSRHFVTALARGLDVLACFTPERAMLGVSEIARQLGLPQPTVWRLCHTLIERGFLLREQTGDKLRLGLPVLSLGYAVLETQDFAQLARPYMQEIAQRFHAGVSLGMRDGPEIVYLQRCIGGSVRFAGWSAGSRVPLLESSMGWACLAALPDHRRDELLANAKNAELQRGLREAIAGYRRSGVIVAAAILHPEVNSVAAPVPSRAPGRELALSCGGHASSIGVDSLGHAASALLRLATLLGPAVPPMLGHRE